MTMGAVIVVLLCLQAGKSPCSHRQDCVAATADVIPKTSEAATQSQSVPAVDPAAHGSMERNISLLFTWEFGAASKKQMTLDVSGKMSRTRGRTCIGLHQDNDVVWSPSMCVQPRVTDGTVCKVRCGQHFSLYGSGRITCLAGIWTIRPGCLGPDEMVHKINHEVHKLMTNFSFSVLFVLNEAASINRTDFKESVSLIKHLHSLTNAAGGSDCGLIAFSTGARTVVDMARRSTYSFIEQLEKLKQEGSHGTHYSVGLRHALHYVDRHLSPAVKVLVFFITNTEDQVATGSWMSAADMLKNQGHVVFPIGIGNYDSEELENMASVHNSSVCLIRVNSAAYITKMGNTFCKLHRSSLPREECA